MSKWRASVLAMLRRRRRSVAAMLVPALLGSVLSGAACPAMSAAPPTAVPAAHHEHSAHAHHDAHRNDAPAGLPAGDCPHCLGGHAAGNVTDTDCGVAAAPIVAKDTLPTVPLAPPAGHHVHVAASAVPPLIRGSPHETPVPTASVPLHIRHCALLI